MMMICFFFFKQKTAYEMRISDWSSDVCSSDLLAQLVAVADNLCLQHAGDALDAILKIAGDAQQGALRRGAGERDGEHREQREIDLVDRRLLGVLRQLGLGEVDLLAHVGQRLVGIKAGVDLHYHVARPEERRGGNEGG